MCSFNILWKPAVDSTIAPPNPAIFFNERFMAGQHKEDTIGKKKLFIHRLECKGLTIDDVRVSRNTEYQVIRPGPGFETGDFVKETLGALP